jgi:hypothetical protein
MVAVAAFRETVARQGLASARHLQRTAGDAVDEAERGLAWLEGRRSGEIASGTPDPSLIAWLDRARDVAGTAYAIRADQLVEATNEVSRATRAWADSRQREERFAERAERLAGEARVADEKLRAEASIETWLATTGVAS